MKIRNGFVSNSSSCSFCIYGRCFDDDEYSMEDKIEKFNSLRNAHLDYIHPSDTSSSYIGLNWCDIKDDETGRQFKNKIQNLIDEFCEMYNLPKVKCSTYEESWYS